MFSWENCRRRTGSLLRVMQPKPRTQSSEKLNIVIRSRVPLPESSPELFLLQQRKRLVGVTGGKSSEVGCGLLCTENILKGPTKRVSLLDYNRVRKPHFMYLSIDAVFPLIEEITREFIFSILVESAPCSQGRVHSLSRLLT